MWNEWDNLNRSLIEADLPHDGLTTGMMGIQMLFAADLQWDRFKDAVARPSPMFLWMVEAHFFLVAADNAYDRLTAWAKMAAHDELTEIVQRLKNDDIKNFWHHQEHLEERMRGGQREHLAKLPAPGNDFISIAEGSDVSHMNSLVNGHIMQFGQEEVDLAAARAVILDVGAQLLAWLQDHSRFPQFNAGY